MAQVLHFYPLLFLAFVVCFIGVHLARRNG